MSTSRLESASQVTAGQVLCLCKRLIEVGDDVGGILAPNGEAQEAGRDAGVGQLLRRKLTVTGRRRMVEDRVDSSEARRPAAQPKRVHEPLACLAPALQLECEHPAEAVELASSKLVLRVALEACVENLADPGVAFEEVRDRQRVFARALKPERERLQTSPNEEGWERIEDRADLDLVGSGPLHQLAASRDDPGHDVVVAVQVLGGRFADEIRAQLKRSAKRG